MCRLREAETFCSQMLYLSGGGALSSSSSSSGRADDSAVLEVMAEVLARLPAAVEVASSSSSSSGGGGSSSVRAARGKAAGRGAIALAADASSSASVSTEAGGGLDAAAAGEGETDEEYLSMSPIAAVAVQEAAALNALLSEVRRSLTELQRALAGQSVWSPPAEALARSLAAREVPPSWMALSGPTLKPLEGWLARTASRAAQLVEWLNGSGGGSNNNNNTDANAESAHPASVPPRVVWLPGLFSPQAFLTAVTQAAARRNGWPLDATALVIEPVKRGGGGGGGTVSDAAAAAAAAFVPSSSSSSSFSSSPSSLSSLSPPPKDCAYLCGLAIEGGRWDDRAGSLDDPRPRELLSRLPLLVARAMPADKAAAMLSSSSPSSSSSNYFACPVYATAARFRQEVATVHVRLPARSQASKWTLAGTAAFLEAEGV